MTLPRKITEFTRTDIVDALLLEKEYTFNGKLDLISFLKRVWPLESMPSQDSRFKDAAGDIWQHMVNNNDWDESELLYQRLGINEVPDEQFVRFLETCMSPIVARDPERIESLATLFNKYLQNDGFIAKPTERVSGRTIYKIMTLSGAEVGQAYEVVLSFAGEAVSTSRRSRRYSSPTMCRCSMITTKKRRCGARTLLNTYTKSTAVLLVTV